MAELTDTDIRASRARALRRRRARTAERPRDGGLLRRRRRRHRDEHGAQVFGDALYAADETEGAPRPP